MADQITPLVQRQIEDEEEEEQQVQPKFVDGYGDALIQRQIEPEEEEEIGEP